LSPAGARNDVWVLRNASAFGATPWQYALAQGAAGSADARFAHTAVYDAPSDRMIVFAGSTGSFRNDLWVLKNATGIRATPTWSLLIPQGAVGSPGGRFFHSAVFDESNNRMIVFGGRASGGWLNDSWVLENASGLGGTPKWTNLIGQGLPGSPSLRYRHSAVYQPATNRMTVFGGRDGLDRNDVWVLDHANGLGGVPTWNNTIVQGDPGSPSSRSGHSGVYDQANDRLIVFGGDDGLPKSDVWVLSNATGSGGPTGWTNTVAQAAPGSPPGRWWHAAVFDPEGNRMIVSGGYNGSYMNDVWVLSHANGLGGSPSWSNTRPLGAPHSPTPRFTPTAVYNVTENRMVLFGGSDGTVRNELWILLDANGSPVLVGSVNVPELDRRVAAALATAMVVFSGAEVVRRGRGSRDRLQLSPRSTCHPRHGITCAGASSSSSNEGPHSPSYSG
ncbi:MAG TPA: hypothetical protein VI893_10140, partial [Thermoplasmata archaeon]|nr:hypothetical protein [Thermoplasmata archaeon]